MTLELQSPCKINLLLNILGRRPDGFHELETILQPVPLHDVIHLERCETGVHLTCSEPSLPTTQQNLVHRAATAFFEAARIRAGVRIYLQKNVPMAAGLGGGSANAAVTLIGLNQLFDKPLLLNRLQTLACSLGSDVPFFLESGPAAGFGRGEQIRRLQPFRALRDTTLLLIRPGFGIPTAWAYQSLARFPHALNGRPGRAEHLIALLQQEDPGEAPGAFYNSLEIPAFHKYPWLALLKEHLIDAGAIAALMSGSGSTTFAIARNPQHAGQLQDHVLTHLGATTWTRIVPLQPLSLH